ncbi:hypothetical protein SEA_MARCIE_44 [Microbacterium phage Marcie]|nr:hypothetical protein SEA_MARCIE_44 [Microbacterium phage Marcie]
MPVPTPRTARARGESVEDRLRELESRQWVAPQRLAGVMSGITDANEVAGTGSFWVSSVRIGFPVATLNSPDPTQNYVIDQYELDSGTRYQIANRIGSPASQIFTERWTRTRSASGTWTAWSVLSLPSKSFAPVLGAGLTLGNGTMSGNYSVADGILFGRISFICGSTTVIGGPITFAPLPIPYTSSTRTAGAGRMTDASTGSILPGTVLVNSSAVYLRLMATTIGNPGDVVVTREINTSATQPFTWAAGDSFVLDFDYAIL